AVAACLMLSLIGVLAGLWADKFDQMAAVTNFVIQPLSFLSGAFYSTQRLPDFWRWVAHLNPFFYMIDAFRYAFLGPPHASHPASAAWVSSRRIRAGCPAMSAGGTPTTVAGRAGGPGAAGRDAPRAAVFGPAHLVGNRRPPPGGILAAEEDISGHPPGPATRQ